jgi:hypothetical protein
MRVTIRTDEDRFGRGGNKMQYVLYIGEHEVPGWLVLAAGSILLFGIWRILFRST